MVKHFSTVYTPETPIRLRFRGRSPRLPTETNSQINDRSVVLRFGTIGKSGTFGQKFVPVAEFRQKTKIYARLILPAAQEREFREKAERPFSM